MSDLLQSGLAWLAAQVAAAASQPIVYQRGAHQAPIAATFGHSEFPVETSEGTRIEHTDRDFLFAAESLVLGGVRATPQKGDRITVAGETFEVLPVNGQQCYRNSDPYGVMLRVFTKKVAHG